MEKVGGLEELNVSNWGDAELGQGSEVKKYTKQVDSLGRSYATGKRKNAIARVWLRPGTGKFVVNQREIQVYFARAVLRMLIAQPFNLTGRLGQFDVFATVLGGGLSGQAGAVRHGISKALSYFEPELRTVLKQNKLLRRDARVTERKKPGQKGARGRFQFSKR